MRRTFPFCMPTLLLFLVMQILGSFLLWLFYLPIAGQVHAAAPITPSGLNTQVSGPIVTGSGQTQTTQYDITGGTRPGGGTNLFHSFGDFNVPNNNIANFLNDSGLATSNILGRVTGGNISNIFGIIQTTGFGNANLFLMNPSGFLFGPNATVNVGGMVAFTSADYLRLADGVLFNAITNSTADALLSAAPVAAFGFLSSSPGAITVQGSQLSVPPGQSISLVGGNITVQSGVPDDGTTAQPAGLSAFGGQINLASISSPGEILVGTLAQAPNINGQSFGNLGTIQISEQSVIDVSGDGGGTVLIRGGQFVLDNSTISANITGPGPVTNGVESIGGGIDIAVSQDAVIQNLAVLETNMIGNATAGVTYGGIHVKADRIEILGTLTLEDIFAGADLTAFTGIRSDVLPGSTGGNSGNIRLEANSIEMKDFAILDASVGQFGGQLIGLPGGNGNAGDISVTANQNLQADVTLITANSAGGSTGNAGNIALTSIQGNIALTTFSQVVSQSNFGGNTGNIALNAPHGDILLADAASVDTQTFHGGALGSIQIAADNLQLAGGLFGGSNINGDNFSTLTPGNITLNLSSGLSLADASFISTVARVQIPAAALNITAHDITIASGSFLSTDSQSFGTGGPLNISTNHLTLSSGGQIRSGSTFGIDPDTGAPVIPSGAGGTVTIQGLRGPTQSVLIDGQNSGIFTNTEGSGAGGNIFVNANAVTLQNGGTLSAKTSGTEATAIGGTITVTATNHLTMTGDAAITASSTGPGNAGNIRIGAGRQLNMRNSSIKTEAAHASGGNIDIQAIERIHLVNSTISASVADGAGGGGNISIDPQFVILQNSQILAQAAQGQGGAITITTNLFLPDADSVVNADSGSGVNGTVTIQSPNAPASGQIQPLGNTPLQATLLLNQRCAALAGGEFSSFTVAGRGSLPVEPGSWLASPLAMLSAGMGEGFAAHEIDRTNQINQTNPALLSLRQIAPAGFLTQAFAVDRSTGCSS